MSLCDLGVNYLYLFRWLFVLQRRREECERKARRGEMDPRLEYTFQLLIDATGLSRGELMDYIFDGNMVCSLLHSRPRMKSAMRNLYSDIHRLLSKSATKWSFRNWSFETAIAVTVAWDMIYVVW